MELQAYVIKEIKKVIDNTRGLQSEIAKAIGEDKGVVSNWLTGKRKSDESFRRKAALMAGMDYNSLVDSYYERFPHKIHATKTQANNGDNNNQADSMTFNVQENNTNLSPELATLIKLIKSKENQFDLVMDLIQIVRDR